DKAIAAYRSLLDIYPHDTWALNNLAILYLDARDFQRAEQLLRRAIEIDSASALQYGNVITAQVSQGKFEEADATLERLAAKAPGHPNIPFTAAALASARFNYDTAEAIIRSFQEAHRASEFWQMATSFGLAQFAEVRGKLSDAEAIMGELMARAERQGELSLYLGAALRIGFYNAVLRGQGGRAIEVVEAALNRHPLSTVKSPDRPYEALAMFYAIVERPGRARALLAAADTAGDRGLGTEELDEEQIARGMLALAEERVPEAIEYFRRADE
ncbi:MAG: tetratricopeptide repeat protein, partial [Gammaproteobacteria bacterium]|nr:tetratricopeptide repeat protein [Gammaproteobacteria bacterium]NIS56488.1 tetratricopeptide repeat protein [Stutzerimonas stutzeri]